MNIMIFLLKYFFYIIKWHLCHVIKIAKFSTLKYDPVVEQCMEAYFISSMNLLWR